MPTPVSAARQCLTPEAAHALDEAVAVARRRGHAQTTSLHAVSALLALAPSSPLREACARARSAAYSPRLQLKALDLCLGVSLDRVSSAAAPPQAAPAEPPISNSLMAAIKRSQANQRRQPESYHFFHHNHQIQSQSSVASVKVELQHLTLSILDDPVVSRVFGEAGFRSSEIKLAIIRPFSQLLRYSRFRGPPVFLCNVSEYPTRAPFGFAGIFGDIDGNSRRIGEILGREKGRNPLLVGVYAHDALRCFVDSIEKRNYAVLPPGFSGLSVVSVDFPAGFRTLSESIERCSGSGIVVNFGNLKAFVPGDGDGESEAFVPGDGDGESEAFVGEITRALAGRGARVWVIGATASYESYLKFVSRFPSIEKDWDLQLLPITSLKSNSSSSSSSSSMAESYPRSSLMESFVPFGGFFSAPSDMKFSLGASHSIRCSDNNCDQDASNASVPGISTSAVRPCRSGLPSWLQTASLNALDVTAKDGDSLNAKLFPTIVGFRSSEPRTDSPTTNVEASSGETRLVEASSAIVLPVAPGNKNERSSKDDELGGSLSNSSASERNRRSPASAASVMTELGLGMSFSGDHNQNDFAQSDLSDVKALFRVIFERVGSQWEAISAISQAIARFRAGEKRRDIWLAFSGPDRPSKKKIASAIAEIVSGKAENLISVDLSPQGTINLTGKEYDLKFRGKNVLDYIAGEMWKNPLAVVFLENIDKSDVLVRKTLSCAIATGKFSDSYGREFATNNIIFVTTVSTPSKTNTLSNYSEERITMAKLRPIAIAIRHASAGAGFSRSRIVFDDFSNNALNKRKLIGAGKSLAQQTNAELAKRAHMVSSELLDLNLPAEDEADSASENSETWLQGFLNHVDESLVFKPVDFDTMAGKIFNKIEEVFTKCTPSRPCLEIESAVMEQFLAAAYLSDRCSVVEDWIERVLRNAFEEIEARKRLDDQCVVKLVNGDGFCSEDQAQNVHLPAKIIIN